ncbi:hypothetical protein PHET_00048 [Paragonimus heterotremus]|uniref:3',5'-cyclic-AMP phosphodiesterase n=1 Tax=Paragonimus heterotremus TaxID=100268 RepID=A0A8J4TK73_9TREM|nr:hypothetical protein PHET_00048 [Paragonimus heterotremus]
MWITCCGCHRAQTRCTDSDKADFCDQHVNTQQTNNELTDLKRELTLNGGHQRQDRRSLPDVVIPSSTLASHQHHRILCIQRKSLQIDSETGRRPTIDIETTAGLAESESTDFDEYTDLKRAIGVPVSIRSNHKARSHSEDSGGYFYGPQAVSKLKAKISVPQRASASNSIGISKTGSGKTSKKHSLIRFFPLKKHWRTQEPPVTEAVTRSAIDKTVKEKAKDFKENALTTELSGQFDTEGDGSESECSKDRLGQLPLSTRHGLGRFRVADSRMTSDLTNQTNRPFTFSELSLNPDGRRTRSRGSADVRRGSLCIFSHVDEPIVTPFAQILASLRRVRSNFIILTNVSSSKDLFLDLLDDDKPREVPNYALTILTQSHVDNPWTMINPDSD